MDEVGRLLVLLALVGGALTLAGGAVAWFLDESRRVRRTLTQALGVRPKLMLVARGRGTGVAFDLGANAVAVTWDKGGWRLNYRIEEMVGVELVVDRQVLARAIRGGAGRPLEQYAEPTERVRLRFLFEDPSYPDFQLDLWRPEDEGRRGRLTADEALHEANRWMARMDALLRRRPPPGRRDALARPAPAPLAPAGPLFDDLDADDPEDVIS